MTTKIPSELSSTPSIVDNGNATAITIDSSERVNIGKASATTGHPVEIQANTAGQGMGIYGRSADDFSFLGFYENGANTELSSLRSNSGFLGINTGGTQRLRIDSDGLKFGSDTAAANALDDYEEGTWTVSDGSGAGLSLTFEKNRYTKIGRLVMAHTRVTYPTTSNSNTATIVLPFSASTNATGSATGGIVSEQDFDTSVAVVAAVDGTAGNRFRSNGGGALTNAQLSGKTLRYTVTYITA